MSEIFTFEKIYRAYLDCRRTKRKTVNALKFEYNLERNLFLLQKELKTKTYKPGRSICFVVKHPSPREIFAASFKDRVVHHILVREVEAIWEKNFIFDSFACRKKKGTHSAVNRLKMFVKRETGKNEKAFSYAGDFRVRLTGVKGGSTVKIDVPMDTTNINTLVASLKNNEIKLKSDEVLAVQLWGNNMHKV